MDLPQKINAALVAYLAGLTPPSGFTADMIQPGESDEDKDSQVIICAAGDATEEVPPKTANMMVPVGIELHTPFYLASGVSSLSQHQAVAEFLEAAVLDDDLAALLTAAQADFTCLGVPQRTPISGQTDGVYVSGWSLQMYCNSIAP